MNMTEEKAKKSERLWLAKYITGPIITIHVFSHISSLLVLAQYGYYAFHKMRYPNDNSTTRTQFTCETNTSTLRYHRQILVQQQTSNWSLYMTVASGVPSVLIYIIFGTYSDRFGRKTFLLVPIIGTFLRTGLCAIAVYMEWNVYLFVFFAFIEGISGTQFGPIMIGYTIAADLTSSGKIRTFAIALIDISAGLGVLVGMLSSGYMIKGLGFFYPFTIATILLFINILLIIFVLPETHTSTKTEKKDAILTYLKNAFLFYVRKDDSEIDKRKTYILCLLIFAFAAMANLGRAHVDILYELNAPFCWNSVQIGIFGMLRTAIMHLIGLLSIRLMQKFLQDETIAIIGAISGSLAMIIEGFAPNSIAMYLVVLVGIGGFIPLPVTRGIMSRMTSPEKQGSLLSGIGALTALCNLMGTLSANGIYAKTVGIYRGLVYFVMAAYYAVAISLIVVLKVKSTGSVSDKYSLEQEVNGETKVSPLKIKPV